MIACSWVYPSIKIQQKAHREWSAVTLEWLGYIISPIVILVYQETPWQQREELTLVLYLRGATLRNLLFKKKKTTHRESFFHNDYKWMVKQSAVQMMCYKHKKEEVYH